MAEQLSEEDRANLTRVIMSLFDEWRLRSADRMTLLGLAEARPRELRRYEGGAPFPDERDLLDRAEHLLAIHDCLRTAYPRSANMASHWLIQANRRLGQRTPLEVMLEGMDGLRRVRGQLDCTQNWHW